MHPFYSLRLLLIVLLCIPALADAQTITSYQMRVYLTGGGAAPVTTYDIPAAAVTCGQPKVTVAGAVTNPTRAAWDDPADPARDCVWTDTGSGVLFALPFSLTSTYTASLVATNAAGTGPESPRSNPFSRPGLAPGALANVRLSRP